VWRQWERGETLKCGVTQSFIFFHQMGGAGWLAVIIKVRGVDGHDLGCEAGFIPGLRGQRLRTKGELISVRAGDVPLLRDALCTLELAGHLILLKVGLWDGNAEAEFLGSV